MDVEATASAWAAGWERAWRDRDPDAVAALYSEEAVFRSHPFREPHLGRVGAREYAAWAFAEEDAVHDVRFGDPIAAGDRAAVEYWAVVVVENGAEVTIAGIAVLRFDDAGLVAEQHDYWALGDGAGSPWSGWGACARYTRGSGTD